MYVIQYLKEHGLQSLVDQYHIKVNSHEDGRVILNYDQIRSPKFNNIVDECRGLCLDKDFNLVARGFNRFYNIEERKDKFNFDNCLATTKLDGSITLLYNYDNEVCFNTRGSYADGDVNGTIPWSDLMDMANPHWRDKFKGLNYTFVGELCSLYNRVVVPYNTPKWYLLSVFEGEKELSFKEVLSLAKFLDVPVPEYTYFSSSKEVVDFVHSKDGKEFEGVVVQNGADRVKCKNPTYVQLHHMFSNSAMIHAHNLVPIIMRGESAEVLAYFPELREYVERVEDILRDLYTEADNYWFTFKYEKNQKKFAQAILPCRLSSLLFSARKNNTELYDEYRKSEDLMVKLVKSELNS